MSGPSREDRIAAMIAFEKAEEKAKSLKLKKIKQFGYKNPSIFEHMKIEEWTERFCFVGVNRPDKIFWGL